MVQIVLAITIDGIIVFSASSIKNTIAKKSSIMLAQKWISGTILGLFAVSLTPNIGGKLKL